MNRYILRGLTVAGFAAGAWLLGGAIAYADDTSTDTTTMLSTTLTVQVGVGTPAPTTATGRVTATARTSPAVHARATLDAAVATTVSGTPATVALPVSPADAGVAGAACVDLAVGDSAVGCGPATGTPDASAAASGTVSVASALAGGVDAGVVIGNPSADTNAPAGSPTGRGSPAGAGNAAVSAGAGNTAASAGAGMVTGSGGLTGMASAGGVLPTTGIDLRWPVGVGFVLLVLGAALRRRTC
jgi:hypothetical protein